MSDSSAVPPALSPEEWVKALRYPPGVVYGFEGDEGEMSRHRMAAMCLYGIPEGFTREDVAYLEGVRNFYGNNILGTPREGQYPSPRAGSAR